MAREIENRLIAAAHVAGDGSTLSRGGFGTIDRLFAGTYQFTPDGVQSEVFTAGEVVVNVSARGLFFVGITETLPPGGPIQVELFGANDKVLTDGEFDIVVMNARGPDI